MDEVEKKIAAPGDGPGPPRGVRQGPRGRAGRQARRHGRAEAVRRKGRSEGRGQGECRRQTVIFRIRNGPSPDLSESPLLGKARRRAWRGAALRFRTFATSPERERGVGRRNPSLALGAGFEIGSSMAGFAWLAVRQAQEAMKHGRLEEALRLLNQPHAQEHRNAAALTTKLARAFVVRAERFLRKDDAEAAWRDLLEAEHLRTAEKNAERLARGPDAARRRRDTGAAPDRRAGTGGRSRRTAFAANWSARRNCKCWKTPPTAGLRRGNWRSAASSLGRWRRWTE